jgi:hypothetical protein
LNKIKKQLNRRGQSLKKHNLKKKVIGTVAGITLFLGLALPVSVFAANNDLGSVKDSLKKEFKAELQNHSSFKSFDMKGFLKSSVTPKATGSTINEQEPNDNPFIGQFDYLPYNTGMVGAIDYIGDFDFHQITVKRDGTVFLAGESLNTGTDQLVGFLLVDQNLNVVPPTDGQIHFDPTTGVNYEIMNNVPSGVYYAVAFDGTSTYYNYNYFLYAGIDYNTPPSAPQVNPINDHSTVITGMSYGTVVTAAAGSRGTLGTATVNPDGSYSIPITPQSAGTKIVITAADTDDPTDNVSPSTSETVSDKTPPAAPKPNPVDDNDKAVSGKSEAKSKVTVKNGTTILGSVYADINGNFTLNINPVAAGSKLYFTATDAAGNTSSVATIVVVDKTPPAAPKVNPIGDNSKLISGKAEANSTIIIKNGGNAFRTITADRYGNFAATLTTPFKAGTKLYFNAKDKAGNVSATTTVTVADKTPPVLTVNSVYHTYIYVTGKSEKGASITIKVGSKVLGTGRVDSYGHFKVRIAAQRKGTVISVIAGDAAKNNRTVNVTVK